MVIQDTTWNLTGAIQYVKGEGPEVSTTARYLSSSGTSSNRQVLGTIQYQLVDSEEIQTKQFDRICFGKNYVLFYLRNITGQPWHRLCGINGSSSYYYPAIIPLSITFSSMPILAENSTIYSNSYNDFVDWLPRFFELQAIPFSSPAEDFLDIAFCGRWASSSKLTRVNSGNRYDYAIMPTLNDKRAEMTGNDGTILLNSSYKRKQFNIQFAFDDLVLADIQRIKDWFNIEGEQSLVFNESPDWKWKVRITGTPQIKYVPFDENGSTVYKGELTIQFTAYNPFGYKKVSLTNAANYTTIGNTASYFVLTYNSSTTASSMQIGTGTSNGIYKITLPTSYNYIQWNTKTGLVTAGSAAESAIPVKVDSITLDNNSISSVQFIPPKTQYRKFDDETSVCEIYDRCL